MTLFIGPVGDDGGPSIKNKLLLKYLDIKSDFAIYNTEKKSKNNIIKIVLKVILSKEKQVILAVSKRGRMILFPIVSLRKLIKPSYSYSLICIGGTIVQESLKHPHLIKPALLKADIISVETKKIKKDLEKILGLSNIHYMPNYKEISKNTLSKRLKFEENNLKFVFLSSVRNIKGIATMINAFKEILEIHPTAILDIYGPIRPDFDKNIFKNIQKTSQVNYKGVVENEDVIKTLSKYHVFIFPTESNTEGFPAVLIEAFLAGLIVVASDIKFNTEIVTNNVNGWTFVTGNKTELINKLLKCFNNVEVLEEISKINQDKATNFDAESVIKNYKVALSKMEWEF